MQDIEEIYKEHFETVYKYLFCLTHNSDLSEELTQETFYRAVLKINSFRGDSKMSVWLCQIAKNLWYDELKRKKKIDNIDEINIEFLDSNNDLENNAISKEEKLNLYKKMQKLDDLTREVMYMRITGELSFREIGDILNKTENWARVTFYRGKTKIKEDKENE